MGAAVLAFDDRCRLLLERGEGPRTAVWLMCNPSTADAEHDDPTIRRCRHFSEKLGCGRFLVVNLWALRTPYPADLWAALGRGEYSAEMSRANLDMIVAAGAQADVRVVAFGAEPWRRYRQATERAVWALLGFDTHLPPYCLGTTADGAPLHPLARGKLAVRNDAEPFEWSGLC